MKLFPILLLLCCLKVSAQSGAYVPLALDTSCYWTHAYQVGGADDECFGYTLTLVEKDTIIGSHSYAKLRTYTTGIEPSANWRCVNYLSQDKITLVREDTQQRKVLDETGKVLLDFSKNVGDTIISCGSFLIIDSVTHKILGGINRRCFWTHNPLFQPTMLIEGIGAVQNFPVADFGEWMIPGYRMLCFSKSGYSLFSADSPNSCRKLPRLAVGVTKIHVPAIRYTCQNGLLVLQESPAYPVTATLHNLNGQQVFGTAFHSPGQVALPDGLPAGMYVLQISGKAGRLLTKVIIP
jgi:hypothetical protein